jgi:hypothetical protein
LRLTSEQLQEVMKKYGVDELYSWSKVNTFMTSPYEFYLQYILYKKPDVDNCAYAPLGGCVHQIIEDYYSGKIEYEDMIDNFEDSWITAIEIANLLFDRNDEIKNNNIKNKYKEDLTYFFKQHKTLENKVELERFLSAKIGDYVLQGYADAITKDNDGNFVIIDWKTSTKYSSKALEEHSGQLTVYAISLMQLGVPLEKIRCAFNFLKYCTVEYEQANGTVKTRDIERFELGEKLQSNLRVHLKKLGYEDKMDEYLKMVIDTNNIECLPKDVQAKYKISDCYCYIDLNEKLVEKWTNEIITTIKDIELRRADWEETHSERVWWDTDESVKAQSYYFSTLCGYSANIHKPYKAYLDKLEAAQNGSDMFSGLLGSNTVSSSSNVINNKSDDLDLSWLENL